MDGVSSKDRFRIFISKQWAWLLLVRCIITGHKWQRRKDAIIRLYECPKCGKDAVEHKPNEFVMIRDFWVV